MFDKKRENRKEGFPGYSSVSGGLQVTDDDSAGKVKARFVPLSEAMYGPNDLWVGSSDN